LETRCERRGQLEVGIVTHNGHIFAAFGSSVNQHNVTGYTRHRNGCISLTRWCGSTMLACRSEIVRTFHDGSIALMFRLTHGRFVIGYALGDEGMLFRGELLVGCDHDRARKEVVTLANYWSEIDTEDECDPWHGEPDETDGDYPDW
jgi:hypothetical protein